MRMLLLYLTTLWASSVFCQLKKDDGTSSYLGSSPFQTLSGGVVMVTGTLDGWRDSLHFILDTGSGGISVDSSKASSMGFISTESIRLSGIGGLKETSMSNQHTLHLNGISTSNLNFHIYDYRLLSSIYGVEIDGVIGYAFFSRYIIHLDHEKNIMSIFSKGLHAYPKKGRFFQIGLGAVPTFPMVISDNTTTKHPFYFDSGAGLAVLLNADYCSDSSIFTNQKKRFTTRAEGVGGKKRMQLTTLKKCALGSFVFRDVPTYIFNDEFGVIGYPAQGGLLGNEILRRFNIILNYQEGFMHLTPNIHYNDPFEYGYSGFSMLVEGEDVFVEDVITDSPAHSSGLRSGDIIVGINGDFSGNIQIYRTMIQETEKPVKLLVKRNNELLEMSFRPISIL